MTAKYVICRDEEVEQMKNEAELTKTSYRADVPFIAAWQ